MTGLVQKLQKLKAQHFSRKLALQRSPKPLISFTFDDFPISALTVGGEILSLRGLRGTYYAALGLMGKMTSVGQMFSRCDLESALAQGHEIACHTINHVPCCDLNCSELVRSCENNRSGIAEILGGYQIRQFSFPRGAVTLSAKTALISMYETCRTVEPGINRDPVDFGFLRANRLYSQYDIGVATKMIRDNQSRAGWLILYTHDISDRPSPFGCTPEYFRDVVNSAIESGAEILPVSEAAGRFGLLGEARI